MVEYNKPAVGSWIRVTTDYTEYKRGFVQTVQRVFTTVGKVVESADWEGKNTFALLVQDPKPRVSTIDLKFVKHIEDLKSREVYDLSNDGFANAEEKAKAKEADRTYDIAGSKGNTYLVSRTNAVWTCNCMAGMRGRACKHVTEAKEKFKAETA